MSNYTHEELCEIVHQLLNQLPKYDKKPSECDEKIPENGIYFWYEPYELRVNGELRITRVGTHRSVNRLKERIEKHYETDWTTSTFRVHIGSALMTLYGEDRVKICEWYKDKKHKIHAESFEKYKHCIITWINNDFYRI